MNRDGGFHHFLYYKGHLHVILRQLHPEVFLLLIPCVYRMEETDQKLKLQSDPTALHQN